LYNEKVFRLKASFRVTVTVTVRLGIKWR